MSFVAAYDLGGAEADVEEVLGSVLTDVDDVAGIQLENPGDACSDVDASGGVDGDVGPSRYGQ